MAGPTFSVVGDTLPSAPKAPSLRPLRAKKPRKTTVGVDPATRTNRQSRADGYALATGREIAVAKPSEAPETLPEDAEADIDDLAAVVVRKTQRLLAAGKVVPTLRDGLTAQQLLDRRAEKAADRRFMLNLALAMAGGNPSAPQKYLPEPQEDVIEGEYEEADLAPAHLRAE